MLRSEFMKSKLVIQTLAYLYMFLLLAGGIFTFFYSDYIPSIQARAIFKIIIGIYIIIFVVIAMLLRLNKDDESGKTI